MAKKYHIINMQAEQLNSVLTSAGELGGVRVRGLMVIPPAGDTRRYFEKTYNMYIDIISKKYDNVSMKVALQASFERNRSLQCSAPSRIKYWICCRQAGFSLPSAESWRQSRMSITARRE